MFHMKYVFPSHLERALGRAPANRQGRSAQQSAMNSGRDRIISLPQPLSIGVPPAPVCSNSRLPSVDIDNSEHVCYNVPMAPRTLSLTGSWAASPTRKLVMLNGAQRSEACPERVLEGPGRRASRLVRDEILCLRHSIASIVFPSCSGLIREQPAPGRAGSVFISRSRRLNLEKRSPGEPNEPQ